MNEKNSNNLGWEFVEKVISLMPDHVRIAYIWGPPGVGKTYAAYQGYQNKKHLLFPVTMTEDTPSAELRGHYLPSGDGGANWHDGMFTKAMKSGGRLVVNEVTHSPADCLAMMFPVFESIETARLILPTGETVKPQKGFHVICTDNLPPEELPDGLRDRFDVTLLITEPHPEALKRLSKELQEPAKKTISLERERYIGIRSWMSFERLRQQVGDDDAAIACFGEYKAEVMEAIKIANAGKGK